MGGSSEHSYEIIGSFRKWTINFGLFCHSVTSVIRGKGSLSFICSVFRALIT